MKRILIDTRALTSEEYWKIFGQLISAADAGTILGCLGWILYWLDHIPGHIFHMHPVTLSVFLACFLAGLWGASIIIRTRNHLGTRIDRVLHILKVGYAFLASLTGMIAFFTFPPHPG